MFILLFCLLPILILIIISTIDTRKYGVFKQKRVGENGSFFVIFKIRTINENQKISRLAKFLRRTKIDEIPQLFNILFGDMSFVGPRPDLIGFADRLKGEDKIILTIKPGLTGPSSIKYFDEEKILKETENKEKIITTFWKDKIKINKDYILNYSFCKDIYYLLKTIQNVVKSLVV